MNDLPSPNPPSEAAPPSRSNRLLRTAGIACLVAATMLALWQTRGGQDRMVVSRKPEAIMGTSCRLDVIVRHDRVQEAHAALELAEKEIRRIEARMSTWIDSSEMSRLNSAKADVFVPLSDESLALLREAQAAHRATDGAFDITCRPVIELWRRAAQDDRLPTGAEIEAARAQSDWSHFEIKEKGVIKKLATARVDLGGIAKGYAIDQAAEVLLGEGIEGALVDIGGDVRIVGIKAEAGGLPVKIKNPEGGILETFKLSEGGVCTSGDYARPLRIKNLLFSHIIDPRTGRPTGRVTSVTVTAEKTQTADIWATALNVLGPEGIEKLPEGVEAMLIIRTKDGKPTVKRTAGFAKE